jgi:hypothetical protein
MNLELREVAQVGNINLTFISKFIFGIAMRPSRE